jgi:hypothetical protein
MLASRSIVPLSASSTTSFAVDTKGLLCLEELILYTIVSARSLGEHLVTYIFSSYEIVSELRTTYDLTADRCTPDFSSRLTNLGIHVIQNSGVKHVTDHSDKFFLLGHCDMSLYRLLPGPEITLFVGTAEGGERQA